jgi:hypothetical protein
MLTTEGKARNKIRLIIVLLIIGILLIAVVSAGDNIVTSSTGKLIITPWKSIQTQTYCGNLPDNMVSTSSNSHQIVGMASSTDYNIQPDYNIASKCIDAGSQFPGGLTIGDQRGTNFHINDTGSNPTIVNPTNSYPGIIMNIQPIPDLWINNNGARITDAGWANYTEVVCGNCNGNPFVKPYQNRW